MINDIKVNNVTKDVIIVTIIKENMSTYSPNLSIKIHYPFLRILVII